MKESLNPSFNESSSLEKARRLILKYGWNSTCYQILNPGIEHWFSAKYEAVVGFVACYKTRVVAGAPICRLEDLREVCAEFEADAARNGERVCYFCAEARLESVYADSPEYSKVLLGAQPVWQPKDWEKIVAQNKSLRAQVNRARNKNVIVSEWSVEKAQNNHALAECLRRWLGVKGLPPLHFLVEPNTLGKLNDRRVFVAEQSGAVAGFVLLSPVAKRNGWLFEQFVHCPNAPNGTVELLIDAAMRVLASDNYGYATLGLSPLSKRAEIKSFRNPFWLRVLLAWMRKHGQRFYNFDGLDRFKAKLQPAKWEPVFAISNEKRLSPNTLYAIAAAFSENAPIALFFGGLRRAFVTELGWLKRRADEKISRRKQTS